MREAGELDEGGTEATKSAKPRNYSTAAILTRSSFDTFLENEIVGQETIDEGEENIEKPEHMVSYQKEKDLDEEKELVDHHHIPSFLSFPSFSAQRDEIVEFFESLPVDEIVQYIRVTLSGALILAAIIVLYFAYLE